MSSLLEQLVAGLGTAWCPACRRREKVVDVHDEPGTPDRHGRCDMYVVSDLACGHQNAVPAIGQSSWVL